MARNDWKQNPDTEERRSEAESGSDSIREPEQVLTDAASDDTELPAELFTGDTDDMQEEDLLLEKNLAEIMRNLSAGESLDVTESDSTDADEDLLDLRFDENEDRIEIPIPDEEDDASEAAEDVFDSEEESVFGLEEKGGASEEVSDAAVPANEPRAGGLFASFFGSAFGGRKKVYKEKTVLTESDPVPEQTAEAPMTGVSADDVPAVSVPVVTVLL